MDDCFMVAPFFANCALYEILDIFGQEMVQEFAPIRAGVAGDRSCRLTRIRSMLTSG